MGWETAESGDGMEDWCKSWKEIFVAQRLTVVIDPKHFRFGRIHKDILSSGAATRARRIESIGLAQGANRNARATASPWRSPRRR